MVQKRMTLLLLLAATACSPLAPKPMTALSITVMGNHTQRPLVGVPVVLKFAVDGAKLTDAEGRATWHVLRHSYQEITVCGGDGPHDTVEGVDVGWLTSLPERECGR